MSPSSRLTSSLLDWYAKNQRTLPWRNTQKDPYAVWLSEVMLQQTGVKVVSGYYRAFLTRWPTLEALAQAPLEEVLHAWAGLGYYSRARNLHAGAQHMWAHWKSCPKTLEDWLSVPGVGPYTARAVCAIAFNAPMVPVDGNVERVLSRLYAISTPLPHSKREIKQAADALALEEHAGDFCQALMDLGSLICTPRKAHCTLCPWESFCQARALGHPESFPYKIPGPKRSHHFGCAFLIRSPEGILVRRRPLKGILGGMTELPTSAWRLEHPSGYEDEAAQELPVCVELCPTGHSISHTFTHFHLRLSLWKGEVGKQDVPAPYRWVPEERMLSQGLPSLMKKAFLRACE